ncbi:hypothetical protein Pnap_2598 [Polaromonas naphthalenivorans CJ2]|uniref:Uncharacterized protein n=1 Tax=Polaromonas naphthalenivorans (strain CJ2) TaxID=365044 RepID=A1VQH3_POLNA|nr:hypothetical protein Pnap_2598 [Polaromonas naphthalenivorans CJ2]
MVPVLPCGQAKGCCSQYDSAHGCVTALARKPAAQSRVIICACPRTATLQTPLAVTERLLFRAAVQSNEVYPPRLAPLPLAGIVARQINADRYAYG